MMEESDVTKVMVGMSGGVDSSVCALLLQKSGFEVCGGTLRLVDVGSSEAAEKVASELGISYRVFDRRDEFARDVIGRFVGGYADGDTPNPCVDCNRFVKFPMLLAGAREMGAAHIATGHYARIAFDESSGRWTLLRGRDSGKDQSYVLYGLSQDILAHTLMPLGWYEKEEVRTLAHEEGLSVADRPESQDICFIPDGDYIGFLARDGSLEGHPGDIVDVDGRILGHHQGLFRYTIGQRKGIGIPPRRSDAQPWFVRAKDIENNRLIVDARDGISVRGCQLVNVNWVSIDEPSEDLRVMVKTRYRQQAYPATLSEVCSDDTATVLFDEPLEAVAQGQACVFYDGDMVLGGGTIASTLY